jgi:hypothetical protein
MDSSTGGPSEVRLKLDDSRLTDADEAWIPVITPDGPGGLIWRTPTEFVVSAAAPEHRLWDCYPDGRTFLINRWKCGSKSFPLADVTSSSVHHRTPRNSTWSMVISTCRDPSLMNHKLTSV